MNVSQIDTMNPVRVLHTFGQSVWMDYIRRNFMTSGELRRVIVEEGISGVTSNPTIFAKAISGNSDYTEALSALRREPGLDAKACYERLAIEDIRTAADLLQPV
jgi:transaldolase